MNRRTEELSSSTRSEILMSIGAALFLVGVVALRLQIAHEGLLEFGFAAAMAWVAISLYCFRHRIWRDPSRDAVAATGLEYYRGELERRRDHLRNGWWRRRLQARDLQREIDELSTLGAGERFEPR